MGTTKLDRVLAVGLLVLLGFVLGVATTPTLGQALRGYPGWGNGKMMAGQGDMMQSAGDAGDYDCGYTVYGGTMGMMGTMGMNDVERSFIQMMIPHHEDAVAMAELALLKANHPELKALAAGIKRVQTAEIEQMRAWYKEWYGADVPKNGSCGMGMMGLGMGAEVGMRMDLDYLANAREFDKAFIQMMIPHHNMAVMMSNMVLVNGEHEEVRDLAQKIVAGQSVEIRQMRQWYRHWYE